MIAFGLQAPSSDSFPRGQQGGKCLLELLSHCHRLLMSTGIPQDNRRRDQQERQLMEANPGGVVSVRGRLVAMSRTTSDALLQAVTQLRELFPEWRFGQLVANLATAAGCQEPDAIWDVEDEQLLAAAQRLIARNRDRQSAQT